MQRFELNSGFREGSISVPATVRAQSDNKEAALPLGYGLFEDLEYIELPLPYLRFHGVNKHTRVLDRYALQEHFLRALTEPRDERRSGAVLSRKA